MREDPPGERAVDVVGLGVAVRDLTVWLDHFPAPDEKLAAEAFVESGGGPVPTALVALSRLGARCAFAGLVGDDRAGRFVRDDLRGEGIDVRGLALRPGADTPASVILVVGAHRTICEWRQKVVPLEPEALVALGDLLDRCRCLHVDGRMPEAQVAAARRVRAAGGRVSLDAGHPRPGVDALLPLVDVAILSHTYPERIAGRPAPETFLAHLVERLAPDGPRIAGLTLGAEGCVVRAAEALPVRVPGHRVDVVDTTGAGDVFHGAFLAALFEGEPWDAAARFANAAAALKCAGRTGRAPLPDRAAIRRRAGLPA